MSKSSIFSNCKRDILDIYKCAIDAARPEHIIKDIVSIENDVLAIADNDNQKNKIFMNLEQSSIHVVGGGKSVLGMAKGLAEVARKQNVTHLFSRGKLSLPIGLRSSLYNEQTRDLLNCIDIKCLFGSHNNLPDHDSIIASEAILDSITTACSEDKLKNRRPIFIVLISGGGSACLTKPKYIDLNKKLELIRFLVQKGANIIELNKVRRFFSSIKGGQLAAHILKSHPKSQILTLVLSDVIGDCLEYIASGPTFISSQNSTSECRRSMLEVLKRYDYENIEQILDDTTPLVRWDTLNTNQRTIINHIIGNNKLALRAAASRASELGYNVKCLGNDLQGPSESIVEKIFAGRKRDPAEALGDKFLVLAGGEATIDKLEGHTWGKGGRAQEMALDYIIMRMFEKLENPCDMVDVFLAGGTDGQDGPTDVAGCLASFDETLPVSSFSRDDALQAKICHDSTNFWLKHKPDWLIRTGLTGTNVMDLYMYLEQRAV